MLRDYIPTGLARYVSIGAIALMAGCSDGRKSNAVEDLEQQISKLQDQLETAKEGYYSEASEYSGKELKTHSFQYDPHIEKAFRKSQSGLGANVRQNRKNPNFEFTRWPTPKAHKKFKGDSFGALVGGDVEVEYLEHQIVSTGFMVPKSYWKIYDEKNRLDEMFSIDFQPLIDVFLLSNNKWLNSSGSISDKNGKHDFYFKVAKLSLGGEHTHWGFELIGDKMFRGFYSDSGMENENNQTPWEESKGIYRKSFVIETNESGTLDSFKIHFGDSSNEDLDFEPFVDGKNRLEQYTEKFNMEGKSFIEIKPVTPEDTFDLVNSGTPWRNRQNQDKLVGKINEALENGKMVSWDD